jgi:hypothetical protein
VFQTPPIITKTCNKFKARPTMCISSAKEGKTQAEWIAAIKMKSANMN